MSKALVISFLESDRTLTGARNLYNKLPNRRQSFLAGINRLPANNATMKRVAYELCRCVGLSEHQMNSYLSKPIKSESPSPSKSKELSLEQRVLDLNIDKADYNSVLKPLAKEVATATSTPPKNRKKSTLLEYLSAYQDSLKKK